MDINRKSYLRALYTEDNNFRKLVWNEHNRIVLDLAGASFRFGFVLFFTLATIPLAFIFTLHYFWVTLILALASYAAVCDVTHYLLAWINFLERCYTIAQHHNNTNNTNNE